MLQNYKERNNNIEILRIVAMFMIIADHAIMHTEVFDNLSTFNFYIIKLLNVAFNVATNVYVLISGYLLCDKTFKIKKVFNLWVQVFLYSTLIYIFLIAIGQVEFSYKECIKVLMPISGNQYWFARVYLGLYILSPFLNILIKALNKKQFQYLLIVCTVLFSLWGSFIPYATTLNVEGGNSIIWFCVLYMFAAYIRIHGLPFQSNKLLVGLTACFFAFAYISNIIIRKLSFIIGLGGRGASLFTTFNSFPMLFGAIGLLCVFINLPQTKKFTAVIQWFSLSTFSVYLIHENKYLRDFLWDFLKINEIAGKIYIAPYILLVAILILIVCTIIDKAFFVQINKFVGKIEFKKLQTKINLFIH